MNDLAIAGGHVYWVDYFAGVVRRIATTGGGATTLADARSPMRVVVDGQHAYWINRNGGVHVVPTSGGDVREVSPDLPCESGDCGRALVVDETSVYWLDDERMMSWSKTGGSPVELDAPDLSAFSDLAVDAQNIYWMSVVVDEGPVLDPDYAVRATPKAGGVPETLAVFDEPWVGPALDDANLYVARADGVWRVPKAGTGAVQLAATALTPYGITTDGAHVYVVERSRVLSVPVDGGELVTIACARGGAFHRIAVDDTTVYWNDEDANTILALPK